MPLVGGRGTFAGSEVISEAGAHERYEDGEGRKRAGGAVLCLYGYVGGWLVKITHGHTAVNGVVRRHGSPVMVTVMFCTS